MVAWGGLALVLLWSFRAGEGAAFVYSTCKRGWEKLLKYEVSLAQPELRFAFSRPGLMTWKCPDGVPSPTQINARNSWFSRSSGESLLSQAQSAADVLSVARELKASQSPTVPLRLHCWAREEEEGAELSEHPQVIEDRAARTRRLRDDLLNTTEGAGLFHADGDEARAGDVVLDVIVGEPTDKALAFVGFHKHAPEVRWTGFPNDCQRAELPLEAPSRAYLKTEQAIRALGLPVQAGQVALEVGSAPGGSVLSLLNRGLSVVGVDPCPADRTHSPVVAKNSKFHEIRLKLHQLGPQQLAAIPHPAVHWVLCDANIDAWEAAPQIATVCQRLDQRSPGSLKGLIFTVKLGGPVFSKQPEQVLEYLDFVKEAVGKKSGWDPSTFVITSLPANRQEVLLFAPSPNAGWTRKK